MTPHFTKAELTCKCGCGMLPEQDFMDRVEGLRVSLGFSLPVTSGARCASYNSKVSATGASGPHTTGRALDLGVRGENALRLIVEARRAGFSGIGVSQKGEGRFIHLDDLPDALGQPRPHLWSY